MSNDLDGAQMPQGGDDFPIVGLGASAGGLKSFSLFFRALPDRPGMAFVIVQHLAPNHRSELAELLQNYTELPVAQVNGATTVEPNHVYVIPPGKRLSIKQGVLRLFERDQADGRQLLIDRFLRALAEDVGERAICVIFSGTGSDGTLGLKAIKESGGLTMVEDPDSADYGGMPSSALKTGLVDFVLPADGLARKLIDYKNAAADIRMPTEPEALPADETEALQRIFKRLRARTGHDFSHYKRATILRRLARRMQVIQVADLVSYVSHIRTHPQELDALFKDFLISVTNFFRDVEAFDALQQWVLPAIFDDAGDPALRVWVPGCATGEEAYSIAMMLADEVERREEMRSIKIFATDIDEDALIFGRRALYPESIAADVSPQHLERYFKREDGGFRVVKPIREMVLFATHSLIKDAPFSRLDLISCRNLLIYLDQELQESVFELFHYALRPDGYLFLGSSESADAAGLYFAAVEKKERIYQRTAASSVVPNFPPARLSPLAADAGNDKRRGNGGRNQLDELHRRLLEDIAPPSLLVNQRYDVLHVAASATSYLRVLRGEPTRNVLQLIDPDLRLVLRSLLYSALHKGERVEARRVTLRRDDKVELVDLLVRPVEHEQEMPSILQIVLKPLDVDGGTSADGVGEPSRVGVQLEEELLRTRERLQTTIEEYETSNEELTASNEELQSINEELQSTTEELETSKEELQSMNEELTTVNQELDAKVAELIGINDDLLNLISSTGIATLFLNRTLELTRYTPRATELFNIISSDIGRPFSHLSHNLEYDGLHADADAVLRNLERFQKEIRTREGEWLLTRIVPYRTIQDHIEGVVILFIDITERKREEQRLHAEHDVAKVLAHSESLEEAAPAVMAILRDSLEAAIGELWVLDERQQKLVCGLSAPSSDAPALAGFVEQTRSYAFARSEGLIGTAWARREPVWVEDLHQDREFVRSRLAAENGLHSGYAFPLITGKLFLGVLAFYSLQPQAADEALLHMMAAIGSSIGQFIERRRAERELRESEARLQLTLMEAPIPMLAATDDGQFLLFNRVAQEITGYTPDDLPTIAAWAQRVYPDRADEMSAHIMALFDLSARQYDGEFEIQCKSGERRVWQFFTAPLGRLSDGRRMIVSMAPDITERKAAEEQLRALNEELESRVVKRTEQVRALAASLAVAEQRERSRISQFLHDDLQQLLHASQIQMGIVSERLQAVDGVQLGAQMATIEDINRRALALTRSLTVELSPPVLEDEGLVEALGWLASHMQQMYDLHVQLTVNEDPTQALGELAQLVFQIVRELLFNIVKYAEVDEAVLTVWKHNERCEVMVADSGVGFDTATLDTGAERRNSYGLHSIRTRLALFSGTLQIDSQPGEGTRVIFTVPFM